ncbi:MAG: hypothetical protein F4Y14_14325, partial [Acidobacteria bacterium]|nr:hypothetical protein [Acidobacteriota bacterium]
TAAATPGELARIAGGIGDWNSESARERTREIVDAEIDKAIRDRYDFGVESTYSGRPGPALMERARNAGYRIEGIYLGTDSPEINAERVDHRVRTDTGHRIDTRRLPERYKYSLSNLRKTGDQFDQLEILDNSAHNTDRRATPTEQLVLENGVLRWQADELRGWCAEWLERFQQRRAAQTRA